MAANKLERELKRGSAELLILALLEERQRHGYEIGQLIASRSDGAINFHVTSLYPTLYRLEDRGLIEGRWVERAGQRRRRYYKLTRAGRTTLASQRGVWDNFFSALNRVAKITDGLPSEGSGATRIEARRDALMNWQSRIREAFDREPVDDDVVEELAQHAAATYAVRAGRGLRRARRPSDASSSRSTRGPRTPRCSAAGPKREPAIVPPAGRSRGARGRSRRTRATPGGCSAASRSTPRSSSRRWRSALPRRPCIGSVAYGVLLKPLPWADAPRLVRLYETRQGSTQRVTPMLTNATFRAWRESPSATLDAIEAWAGRRAVVAAKDNRTWSRSRGSRRACSTSSAERRSSDGCSSGRMRNRAGPRSRSCRTAFWQQRFGGAHGPARPDAAHRRHDVCDRRRHAGVLHVPGSCDARVASLCRRADGEQDLADAVVAAVPGDRPVAPRQHTGAGRRRGHVARTHGSFSRTGDHGGLRQRRPGRGLRRADAAGADARGPAGDPDPASPRCSCCWRRPPRTPPACSWRAPPPGGASSPSARRSARDAAGWCARR